MTVLAACVGLVLRGALGGGVLFYSDLGQQFEPLRHAVADALATGQVLWTPRLSNGASVLGNPMDGVGYPPSLVASTLGGWLEPSRMLTLLALAHLVWGAAGVWLAAGALGCRRPARWAAAAVVTLAGTTLSATAFPTLQWGLAWIPWVVLAGRRTSIRPGRLGPTLGLATALSMTVLVGEPVGVVAALLGLALLELRPARGAWRRLSACAAAGVAAALLSAPVILPTLRLAAGSVRAAGFTPEGILLWSLHPIQGLELILPGVFGDPRGFGLSAFWARALVAPRQHPLLLGMYLGVSVLVLAAVGLGRRHPDRWPLAVWLGLLAMLALGRFGPLGAWLVELPGGDALRFPVKWMVPAAVPLALLTALGVEALAERGRGASRSLLASSLAALVLLLGFTALVTAGLDGAVWAAAVEPELGSTGLTPGVPSMAEVRAALTGGATRAAVWVAVLALLAATAVIRQRKGPTGQAGEPAATAGLGVPWLAWVVVAVIAVDLTAANWALVPTVGVEAYRVVPPPLEAIARDPGGHRRIWVDSEAARFASSPSSPEDAFRRSRLSLGSYAAVAFGFDIALNVDIEALSPFGYASLKVLADGAPTREHLMLLGAAGVSHLVTPHAVDHPLAREVGTCTIDGVVPLHVYRNLAEVQRARVVPRLTPYHGIDGFIAAVRTGPDDLFARTALVEDVDFDDLHVPAPGSASAGTCRIVRDEGSHLVIRTTGAGGYLILSDCLVTGWSVRVDGKGARLFRADLAFRGVPVPAGEHTVVMDDDPWFGPTAASLGTVDGGAP